MVQPIFDFRFKYRPFSNFHLKSVFIDGVFYPSNENAYQAHKTLRLSDRVLFESCTPAVAKTLGTKLDLREDWEEVKFTTMTELCRQKFCYGEEKDLLLSTGDAELIEGNYWHDNEWGVCLGSEFKFNPNMDLVCEKCKGKDKKNNLGKILMKVRQELNSH